MAAVALATCLHLSVEAKQLPPGGICRRSSSRSGGRYPYPRPGTSSSNGHRGFLVVSSVLSKPKEEEEVEKTAAAVAPLFTQKTVYKDNWFDRIAIRYVSRNLQDTTGLRNDKQGYDGFVEATRMVFRNFGPAEQRLAIMGSLHNAIPEPILALIRLFLTNSKFTRESFAFFTTIFFSWLIGPSEVRESEFQGKPEKNVVYIKKCRFLEETNCVGMCTNLCKIPSQEFIKEKFGMPLTMVPNFEDLSCEMIFGQDPPPDADDPALKQPCYQICEVKQRHKNNCASK